jgi:DNA-binding response OmpR family regulator/tRNA A-37 threonylcarbamoyl transferase component Bud32
MAQEETGVRTMCAPAILIVDEDAGLCRQLETQLQALGYQVLGTAGSSREAIRLAEHARPDLVIMDTFLPGDIDGIETAHVIRHWSIPIIFLTAHTDEATLGRAKTIKPYGYIIKPSSAPELRAAIEMALYKHQAEMKFLAALEKQDPEERTACLDEACADDPALRRKTETLLKAFLESGTILALPEASPAPPYNGEIWAENLQPPPAEVTNGDQSLLVRPRDPSIICRLDHYDVMHAIGKGAMGTLYKGFDAALHRVVAIKVMAPSLASSGLARRRFLREARAMAAIRDDFVIDVYGVGETPQGIPYLVMEFIGGCSLGQELGRRRGLDLRKVTRISYQTACGLAAAHAKGLIHRDIKPSNILLEEGIERIKITDFGLVHAADDPELTQIGVINGTPQFMAPEQANGEFIDCRSDLFSLGSVMYAMCTGQAPFQGHSTMSILKRVCEEMPQPVHELNPDVPHCLIEIIDKLHAKDPARRFQSAIEVADAIRGSFNYYNGRHVPPLRAYEYG